MIEAAITFANCAHHGQTRKGSKLPYILHPLEVMTTVAKVPGATETEIIASVLHDVVEDCEPLWSHLLYERFPEPVVTLVLELTNTSPKHLPRDQRKAMDRERLKGCSLWARKIKLVDRACNIQDIRFLDPGFQETYIKESWALLNTLWDTDETLERRLQCLLDGFRK